ncbi:hypothetical protein pEaSNUABM42_00089 [Erwinia phage pEa_SNUABM_42]|nr:hypothetical protein pEaSNUABM43_00089 [Erwinia phage pEa_SNUABM_43]QVW55406.1 hypothetical protein pEaSNUABM42_00089 [Erwinia phage pEa_SNUABM_42]
MDIDSLPVVEFTGVSNVVPVFDGCGYLVTFRNEANHRTWLNLANIKRPIYMSCDAHAALLAYIAQQKKNAEKNLGWGFSSDYLILGDVRFSSEYFNHVYNRGEERAEYLANLYVALAAGLTLNSQYDWQPLPWDYNGAVISSSSRPDTSLIVAADQGMVTYLRKEFVESPHGHHHLQGLLRERNYKELESPVVETDTTFIKIADRLHGIASTATFPEDGYQLSIELGLGKLDLEYLSKKQIMKMAHALMP